MASSDSLLASARRSVASASTRDFIELAAKVSGRRSVKPFLREWLYGTKTPPMPGHPDWTVNPVVEQPELRTFGAHRPHRRR